MKPKVLILSIYVGIGGPAHASGQTCRLLSTSPAQPLKRETEFVWCRASQRTGADGTVH